LSPTAALNGLAENFTRNFSAFMLAHIRLRQVLEKTFKERLDKLDEVTSGSRIEEPFYVSKF